MEPKYQQILGIRFFAGTPAEAVAIGLRGGVVLVPAAPALVEMGHDRAYCDSLVCADLVIADSGFMVLLWRLITRRPLTRVSGLEYLRLFLKEDIVRQPGKVLYIMPTSASRDKCLRYLDSIGIAATDDDCYVAPFYRGDQVEDRALLECLTRKRPDHIIVGLGGGTQEKLGLYLKRNLDYSPGIHCIGAAIGFLSGDQVAIPAWADYLFLGWAFRIAAEPSRFLPRYWKARRLLPMLLKYRERLPAAAERGAR